MKENCAAMSRRSLHSLHRGSILITKNIHTHTHTQKNWAHNFDSSIKATKRSRKKLTKIRKSEAPKSLSFTQITTAASTRDCTE